MEAAEEEAVEDIMEITMEEVEIMREVEGEVTMIDTMVEDLMETARDMIDMIEEGKVNKTLIQQNVTDGWIFKKHPIC